jgi:phosphate transport system substrate-binding protein
MKNALRLALCLIWLIGCAQPAPEAAKPRAPELRSDQRIVTIPVNADPEELANLGKYGLPLEILASISTGEEPFVTRLVSRATLLSIAGSADGHGRSVILIVPREDVEMLVLTQDLVRRRQASFYLAVAPAPSGSAEGAREKSLSLRGMYERLGYTPPPAKRAQDEPGTRGIQAAEAPAGKSSEAPPRKAPDADLARPAQTAGAPVEARPSPRPAEIPLPDRLPDGRIIIDGSSTLLPVAKLVRHEFIQRYPNVTVDLMGANPGESPSGSGGGFKKFCFGETDISDASRLIKDDEVRKAAANNISFIEIPVAYDGLSVVVHRDNTWVSSLTVQELRAIWEQNSQVQTWRDVRPEFPSRPIRLFGPGRDNGTYDFFMEAIFGKPDVPPRQDITVSTEQEIVARGISSTVDSLGYFGMAYYIEHKDVLRLVAIDSGHGPVLPTNDTVLDGSYSPFSRPLFIYVSSSSLKRPEVEAYVRFFLREGHRLAQAVGYIPLPANIAKLAQKRLELRMEGSMRPIGHPAKSLQAMMLQE